MGDKEYWEIPLDGEIEKDLDTELLEQLNRDFPEDDSPGSQVTRRYSFIFRTVGFLTIIAFFFFSVGYWMKEHNLPPFNLIARSQKLSSQKELQELQKGVVEVNAIHGQGTGFNIGTDGLIITNNHVVAKGSAVYVKFKDGTIFQGKKVTTFPTIDIALIDIEGDDLPFVELAKEELKPEEEVIIIGNPLGVNRIINKGKVIGPLKLKDWQEEVLAIKCQIHKGNSGSPVFNNQGKVAAVIFATLDQGENSLEEGIGVAVPLTLLLKELDNNNLSLE